MVRNLGLAINVPYPLPREVDANYLVFADSNRPFLLLFLQDQSSFRGDSWLSLPDAEITGHGFKMWLTGYLFTMKRGNWGSEKLSDLS